jgi:hypothetical protein
MEASLPAFTVGEGVIVNTRLSLTFEQVPFPMAIKVNVTDPAVRSAALGVYTGFRALGLLNVPVPLVVQAREE